MQTKHFMIGALALTSIILSGCQQDKEASAAATVATAQPAAPTPAPPPREEPPPLPALDISTPENTLKSYWAALDEMLKLNVKPCEACTRLREHQKGTLTGDLLEGRRFVSDTPTMFERQIKETKKKPSKDSAQMVEIVAVIKNVTPYPAEAAPNDYVKKKRESGDKYRYTLVNAGGGWKISEIFMWYEPTRTWLKISSPKPQVPIQTLA
ncbi:MAG: hypothetical protein ACM3SV_08255 [Betaproteobacteria bacterium]